MVVRRRVLLCCEQYSPSVGGVQEVMRQIAERFAQRNLEVVVATGSHPQRPDNVMMNGVYVVSFAIAGNRVRGITGPMTAYQQFLREGRFDAVLIKAAQQWTFDAAVDVLDQISARKVFIPCGFSGLGDVRYADYFKQMPIWLRQFDGLVFYSDTYQDIEFARKHGLTALHLIPNGVDEREFAEPGASMIRAELDIPAADDLLLSVGSIIMAKGHWEVIRAFRRASLDRPATLVVNGNHPKADYLTVLKRTLKHLLHGYWPIVLEALITSAYPGKRVILRNMPRAKLLELFKTSDLFIFASHVEYSPLVLFEAAASSTPFVASDVGNNREIVKWTGAGRIVEEFSARSKAPSVLAFKAAIEYALSDPKELAKMGQSGRRAILEGGYTWDKIVERYLKVLKL